MGIWDREYTKASYGGGSGAAWRSYLPPRAALLLIGLHLGGFFAVYMLRHDVGDHAVLPFMLRSDALHPAAILLHPFGNRSLLTLVFVIYVIWTLGGRITTRFGGGRLWLLYVLGTLISGVIYLGFAQLAPDLAGYELAMPAGALAAWVLAAWRNLSDETVSVFGRLTTVAKATAIGAAIVAGLVFFQQGPAATGWLIAAAAGGLASPIVESIRRPRRPTTGVPWVSRDGAESSGRARTGAKRSADDRGLDELLAKISQEGMDSLTPAEREQLEAARRSKLRNLR